MLAPTLVFNLPAKLWKLEPDPYSDWLSIELRSKEKRTVAFYGLDLSSPNPVLRPISTHSDWWQGILATWRGKMILQKFGDPGLPLRRGVSTWDLASCREVWMNPDWTAEGPFEDEILLRDPTRPDRLASAELHTGKIQAVEPVNWQQALAQSRQVRFQDVGLPQVQSLLEEDDALIPEMLQPYVEGPTPVQIAAHTWKNFDLLSWYQPKLQQGYRHQLGIFYQGELVKSFVLEEAASSFSLDPFMRYRDRMITFDDQQRLLIQSLI